MIDYNTLTVPEATIIQKELKDSVKITPYNGPLNYVAGADISFNKFSTTVYAGIVMLEFPSLKPVGYSLVKKEVLFPYVPGFLAFREVPALLDAWAQLPVKPDILVVDGHGIAHPRRMGIASHFGVLTQQPSIGSAKKKLFGAYEEPGIEKGSYTPLTDKQGQQLGNVLRSKSKVAPIFVSPGHLIDIPGSTAVLMQCIKGYRLPEPTRLAHNAVNQFRTNIISEGWTSL
ncbi:deoxyribonuclease V [Chitinophaga ginsengisegetis]|uniref:deoxyribonuclease V n=1 Tax=Chitinophaga ginsengisegetis TaxID=393003 RepID=UPI000DBFB13B|nr:deoxyribonuclease V [Chitinophaga ginsengisegetis]MDR6567791.1 deoxyribonuclease V [Chitinophaga ginsengisegetis]MDR6647654.1 deoxyribonuclease V [Chitinophaga ginsengisegetis]MDR6654004.1 deoxyribonuclease V [Chitinophaga ginsengisegetis]